MPPNRGKCCELLGVAPTATKDEIQRAYHDLVKVWHPDRFTHDAALALKAQEKLKEINEAYALLRRTPEPYRPQAARSGPAPAPPKAQKTKDTFWESPAVVLLVVLLGMTLLALVMQVFHSSFQNPVSGKSVQDIV